MRIRPLQDRLILRRDAAPEKVGRIIIPENAKEAPLQGEVLAVGNGKIMPDGSVMPLDVKVGEVVLYSKYAGTEIKLDDEEVLMLREEDILAVVERGKEKGA